MISHPASGALIRAAGVENPTAIAITYVTVDRCLRATACLRDAFPDTPIFVRSDDRDSVKSFIKAGATEVIVATGTIASGMGQLLGVRKDDRFGGVLDDSGAAVALRDMAPIINSVVVKKGAEDTLSLADERDPDADPEEMKKLYKLFSTSLTLNDDGKAQLSELVNEILRSSNWFMSDDELRELLGCDSLDKDCFSNAENMYISFSEFVRLYQANRAAGKQRVPNIEELWS
jgi:hypothetical protein